MGNVANLKLIKSRKNIMIAVDSSYCEIKNIHSVLKLGMSKMRILGELGKVLTKTFAIRITPDKDKPHKTTGPVTDIRIKM